MRHLTVVTRSLSLLALCVLAQSVPVVAANPLDCSKESLAAAVAGAREKDVVIPFTGMCAGPIGGTINASGNPVAGVSVNSKAGLDLDAASQLNSFNNGDGLLVQHDSTMTVFNTPQFPACPASARSTRTTTPGAA